MKDTMFMTEGITESERFLPVSSAFAIEDLTYIQEIGRLKSIAPHCCVREKLDSFLIFLVISGSGTIQLNGEKQPLIMGDCVFVDCQQYYEHESSESDPWELIWVHCNGRRVRTLYELFVKKNGGKENITIENPDKIMGLFEKIMEIQKNGDILMEVKSSVIVEQLIVFLIEGAIYQKKNRLYIECNQIREYINENYQKNDLLEKMSKVFQLSIEEMDMEFSELYGIDIYGYITNRRFTNAKELLRFTIKPVSEIIEISGIQDSDLFQKMFREREKMSAEEYRKKWAQWVK